MPQLDKFTYFTQFFWFCLVFFVFYNAIFNNRDGFLGIGRIIKLRAHLFARPVRSRRQSEQGLDETSRKGLSIALSYLYSTLSEVSQWCQTVSSLGTRRAPYNMRALVLISSFGEISCSRRMERQILSLISKSSSQTGRITCRNKRMLLHILHGQRSIGLIREDLLSRGMERARADL
jgi:hypothetical protein